MTGNIFLQKASTALRVQDLVDATIATPADNEILAFDSSTSTWINQTPTEAGLDSIYLKLDGSNANTTIDIGSEDLTTTGTITTGLLKVTGATEGSIPFIGNDAQFIQDNSNLFWDNSLKRLGIGTNTPAATLNVVGGNILWDNGQAFQSRQADTSIVDLLHLNVNDQLLLYDDRVRITLSGVLLIGKTGDTITTEGCNITPFGVMILSKAGLSGQEQIRFSRGTEGAMTEVASIATTGTDLIIKTNNVMAIQIDENQNVGVNVVEPDAKFHVGAGDILIDNNEKYQVRLADTTISDAFHMNTVDQLLIYDGKFRVTSGGNLLVGRTSDVITTEGSTITKRGVLILSRSGTGLQEQIRFGRGTEGAMTEVASIATTSTDLRFRTLSVDAITIDENQNTGFGTAAPTERVTVNGNMVLPKASGNGIKIDLVTPTFGFADILGDQFSKNTGGTRPTLTVYNGVINSWLFGVGDEAFISYHIPHDYVKGTDIFLHIHWSHIGTFVTGGTVTFKATSIYAKGHSQAAFQSTPSVGTFVGTASSTQYQQILTEVTYSDGTPTGLEIDTDDLEPDGVIEMTFEVDANALTVSEGAVPDIFIHFVDLHYQTTGLIGTKAKAPDFYA